MQQNVFHQPNREAVERALRTNRDNAAGVILRLAWLQGLSRDEINRLTWDEVDLEAQMLRLPDRSVPLEGDMEACLRRWKTRFGACGPYVAVSEKFRSRMTPQSVSRLARLALDAEGQERVRLSDLRCDYVLRQLEAHDWPYVLRVSGLSVTTYRNTLADLKRNDAAAEAMARDPRDEAFRIWKILQSDRTSPAGVALWLSCQLGLRSDEIVALTWDQIDFDTGEIRLPKRTVALSAAVSRILKTARASRTAKDDPHVILTPRTRRPLSSARLSTMVRTILIRGGIEDASLRTLRRDSAWEDEKARVMAFAAERGSISRGECMDLLGATEGVAYRRLNALALSGELVRINAKYYPAGAAVPPEKQSETILRYIAENGAAYCQDVAAVLHIGSRTTARILKRMTERGELVLHRRQKRYSLPDHKSGVMQPEESVEAPMDFSAIVTKK